ncbi:Uma2 family endonuclease [cf. Phormidesmis sp. LEGE 11477]|uniref:Uma2 family endonuclease n=1 Tax=cf. Phormidesmis sp. LEGE 11477 TaxID=1828680 RepID=UPI00187FC786|nr:Uma2 family endonuclease [cf. Phormidesmis sp. LEGE 11477]MBE9064506.1 Uma2 family endonuclease [cf. Phormidesmis sp. LEGE 11477]
MVQTQSKPMTLEAFLALPETEPASDFINGQIIQKPMPQGKHSCLRGNFVNVINNIVESNKTACAFPELQCICGTNAIVPDISVFTWEHLPIDDDEEIANVFETAPDWMIEILSPGQRYAKVIRKIQCCLQHGTDMGWLIDPNDRAVLIHRPQKAVQVILIDEPDIVLPMPDFMGGLSYTIKDLFNLLKA